jgi:hypothetical protein
MTLLARCRYCGRIVWPWQRKGWIVGEAVWHPRCRVSVPFRDAEEPDGV